MTPSRFGQQHKLRNLLAACATFQSEVGATGGTPPENKEAAKLKIHRFEALEQWHPGTRAVIRMANHTIQDSGRGSWHDSSRMNLTIELERDLPDDDSTGLEEAEDEILGVFASIVNEMIDLQGDGEDEAGLTYIRITRLDLLDYDIDPATEKVPTDPDDVVTNQKCVWWMRWEVSTT